MDTKPTTFANGVPPEERNGFFGIEEQLMEAAGGDPFVAVVTYQVDEVVHKEVAGVRYPVLKVTHIEPILNAKDRHDAVALQSAAQKVRTGQEALDMGDDD